ncbi:hypothetical protein ES703_23128 [subsurface metagenome]
MVLFESWAILGENYKSIQKAKMQRPVAGEWRNESCQLVPILVD